MVREWLQANMLRASPNPQQAANSVVAELMNYAGTSEHSHHFLIDKCQDIGLSVESLEANQDFQEAVLSVHHAFMASFDQTEALKIIDNSGGGTWSVGP